MMWRILLIGATLWSAFADSSSNAGTSSSRSKFPVELEADTGDPKPGEGKDGVAVLLKPMPEATTMKTWSFLKESMNKIGDQVRQIMQVRNDIAMLQQDLTMQEKLWKQAEIELNQENAKLRGEIQSLNQEVKAGAHVKHDLEVAKQALEEEERRAADLKNQADMDEKRWQTEVGFLDARKNNVTALHREVNETASREISRAEAIHLQLQKDAVTLTLAQTNFQDRIKNGEEKMAFDNAKAMSQQAELKRQIAAMEEGLKRIQGKLKPRAIFDQQEAQLKQGLQKETAVMIEIQAQHQQIVAGCTKDMQEQDAIKCAEEAKLKNREQEKTQFCNAIEVQNQVLKQDLEKCSSLEGIPLAPAPVALPLMVPPVPVRDEERLLVAPAPSPSFVQYRY